MADTTLVAEGIVRIRADVKKAQESIRSLGKTVGLVGLASLAASASQVLVPALGAAAVIAGTMGASMAAAGAAVGAFKLAVIPQVESLKDAVKAHTKYTDAVRKSGKNSKEAKAALKEYKSQLDAMPPATRETAKSFIALQDEFKKWSDSLSGTTMPIFTKGINMMRAALPKLTPFVRIAAFQLSAFLDSLGKGQSGKVFSEFGRNIRMIAGGSLRNFLNSLKNIAVGFAGILNAFIPMSTTVTGGMEALTKKFADFGAGLSRNKKFHSFIRKLKQLFGDEELRQKIADNIKVIAKALGNVLVALKDMGPLTFTGVMLFFKVLAAMKPEDIRNLAYAFVALKLALTGFAISKSAVTGLRSVAEMLSAAGLAGGIGAIATTVGLVIAVLGALIIDIYLFATRWHEFTTYMSSSFMDAMGHINDAFWGVVHFFNKANHGILRDWQGFGRDAGKLWSSAISQIVDLWRKASRTISEEVDIWKDVGGNIIDGITSGAVTAWNATIDWFKALPGRLLGVLKSVFGISSPSTVMMPIGHDIMAGLVEGAKLGLAMLLGFFAGLGRNIWVGTGALGHLLWSKGASAVRGLVNGAKGYWNTGIGFFRGLRDKIHKAAGSFIGTLRRKGGDALRGLLNGARQTWPSGYAFFSGLRGKVSRAAGGFLHTLRRKGSDALRGFLSGAHSYWGNVRAFYRRISGNVSRAAGSFVRTLRRKGSETLSGFLNGAKSYWGTVRRYYNRVAGRAREAVGGVKRTLHTKGREILNGFLNGAKSVWHFFRSFWDRSPGRARSAVGNVRSTLRRKGQEILSGFLNGAKSYWHFVSSFWNRAPGRARSAIGRVSSTLRGKGRDLVSGLLSGASARIRAIGGWAHSIKNRVVNAIKHAFGIHSPSTVMASLGGHMMSGLLKGLLRGKSVLGAVVKGLFSSITDVFEKAPNLLGGLFGGGLSFLKGFFKGGGSNSANMSLGKAMMQAMGWSSAQWPALKMLWMGESGWSQYAHNASSGAHGIPQSLPASKMRSAGSDYMTNPATQIKWGLSYIRSRYGSPSAAYQAWMHRRPHWYDQGGWLPKGLNLTMNNTGQKERILSPREYSVLLGSRGTGRRAAGSTTVHLTLENHGVIGSKEDTLRWLTDSLDQLRRRNRLPAALKG